MHDTFGLLYFGVTLFLMGSSRCLACFVLEDWTRRGTARALCWTYFYFVSNCHYHFRPKHAMLVSCVSEPTMGSYYRNNCGV